MSWVVATAREAACTAEEDSTKVMMQEYLGGPNQSPNSDPLQYWAYIMSMCPEESTIAMDILSISPTSVLSEIVFHT